jgi:hypothetical protein
MPAFNQQPQPIGGCGTAQRMIPALAVGAIRGRPRRATLCTAGNPRAGSDMTATTTAEPRPAGPAAPAFARAPVLILASAVGALLLLVNWRYGYFGDELYFLAAGRHLAWGYADQPPLLPLLARAMDTVAPGSVLALRIPAALAAVGTVTLGGACRAQLMAAGAVTASPLFLAGGHLLATSTIDPFLWAVAILLLTRWVRTRDDRLLLWLGAATAVALNAKFLIAAFWLVSGCCLLAVGPRVLLRRPLLWAGAGMAALGAAPTVAWQALHGWPQLAMSSAIAEEVDAVYGGRVMFLPGAVLSAGLLVSAVLLCHGVHCLLRRDELRPYCFLGWAVIGLAVLFLAVSGRSYYLSGMYPLCWAASAVAIERARPARWWRWVPTWPTYLMSFLVVLPMSLPVWPQSWLTEHPALPTSAFATYETGWPGIAASVAEAYRQLPDREHTAVLTQTYWLASALDHYGPALGVPAAYSANRGFWELASPPNATTSVLYIGDDPGPLSGRFTEVQRVGTVEGGAPNPLRGTPIWRATGRAEPWAQLWPALRNFSA